MLRHVLRSVAVASGALVAMAAYAAPAAANEIVPSGCAGSLIYACTGDATPPVPDGFRTQTSAEVPIRLWSAPQTFVPGMTVGGEEIGGVIVPVGGEVLPETTVVLGGPTSPFDTGVAAPVSLCAFVVCYAAGDPVVVPGYDLPLVPVVVPAVIVPSETVEVPVVTTLPTQTTPDITVPAYDVHLADVHVYTSIYDFYVIADVMCRAGGGQTVQTGTSSQGNKTFRCDGGLLAPAADAILFYVVW